MALMNIVKIYNHTSDASLHSETENLRNIVIFLVIFNVMFSLSLHLDIGIFTMMMDDGRIREEQEKKLLFTEIT